MADFELVLPAYNEAASLPRLIERAVAAAEAEGVSPEEFRLVVVNNGSLDDSKRVLEQLAKDSRLGKWLRIIQVERNQGYGFGIASGLRATEAPFVGWSHADLQCDPRDAIRAYRQVKTAGGLLLVKGVRSGRNLRDILVSRVFELCAWMILGIRLHEINAQPKVFPRSLLSLLKNPPKTFAFDLYALHQAIRAGYRIQTMPVLFPPRVHGLSRWAATLAGRYKTILGMIRYMFELRQERGNSSSEEQP